MRKFRLKSVLQVGLALFAMLSFCFTSCKKDDDVKEDAYIEVSVQTLQFSDAGENKTFNIDANCEWAITVDQSWCRAATKTGSGKKNNIVVMCSQNDSDQSREAVLTVKCPTDPSASKDISIVQLGRAATVSVSKSELGFDAVASTETISVAANVDWTISKPAADTWYSVEPVSGEANDVSTVVTVTVEQNEALEARSSSFDIQYVDTQTGDNKTVSITVSQKAIVPSVSVSKTEINLLKADAASEQITLTVQGAWTAEVEDGADWITVDPSEGVSGEYTVNIAVEVNAGQATREAVITFSALEQASATVTVSQSGLAPKVILAEETIAVGSGVVSRDVEFSANYAWSASTADEWLSVSPESGEAGETCTITVTTVKNPGDERIGKVSIVCGPEASAVTTELNVIQDAYDGKDLSETGTSNCYIVNKAGAMFKFNATVQGNGKPDLEKNIRVETLDPKGCYEVWRDNAKPIVTDIKYKNGYISFKTPDPLVPGNVVIAAVDEYNTIIWSWHLWVDNYDAEAQTYPITYTAGFVPPTPQEFMSRNIGALSDGTAGTQDDVIKAYGMMYQWGRKDPFLSANTTYVPGTSAAESKQMYDADGQPIATSGPWCDGGTNVVMMDDLVAEPIYGLEDDMQNSIRYSIENPNTFIVSWIKMDESSNVDASINGSRWIYIPLRDAQNGVGPTYLWGNAYGFNGEEYGTKTIYDPCPLGWRVPDRFAWKFVSKTGATSGNGKDNTLNLAETYTYDENNANNCKYENYKWGFYLCTGGEEAGPLMFLPAAGARSYSQAQFSNWSNIGVLASYWTNGPYTEGVSGIKYSVRLQLCAGRGNENPEEHQSYDRVSGECYIISSMWTAAGMPVRCIKELAE